MENDALSIIMEDKGVYPYGKRALNNIQGKKIECARGERIEKPLVIVVIMGDCSARIVIIHIAADTGVDDEFYGGSICDAVRNTV